MIKFFELCYYIYVKSENILCKINPFIFFISIICLGLLGGNWARHSDIPLYILTAYGIFVFVVQSGDLIYITKYKYNK